MRKLIIVVLLGLGAMLLPSPSGATVDHPITVAHPAAVETVTNHVDPIWPCAYFKPHTGDTLGYYFQTTNTLLIEEWNCSADHLGQYDHFYHVTYNKTGQYYTWGPGWVQMVFGFRKDPEPVSEPPEDKADDGKGDGKFKPNENRDARRQVEGYRDKR